MQRVTTKINKELKAEKTNNWYIKGVPIRQYHIKEADRVTTPVVSWSAP